LNLTAALASLRALANSLSATVYVRRVVGSPWTTRSSRYVGFDSYLLSTRPVPDLQRPELPVGQVGPAARAAWQWAPGATGGTGGTQSLSHDGQAVPPTGMAGPSDGPPWHVGLPVVALCHGVAQCHTVSDAGCQCQWQAEPGGAQPPGPPGLS